MNKHEFQALLNLIGVATDKALDLNRSRYLGKYACNQIDYEEYKRKRDAIIAAGTERENLCINRYANGEQKK